MSEPTYTRVVEAEQVTGAVLAAAEYAEEWFADQPIEWPDLLDRMDGWELPDGSRLDMGESLDSPAIRKIKKHIRELRRNS